MKFHQLSNEKELRKIAYEAIKKPRDCFQYDNESQIKQIRWRHNYYGLRNEHAEEVASKKYMQKEKSDEEKENDIKFNQHRTMMLNAIHAMKQEMRSYTSEFNIMNWLDRKYQKHYFRKICIVQSLMRKYPIQAIFLKIKKRVIKLQAVLRQFFIRQRIHRIRRFIIMIQMKYRDSISDSIHVSNDFVSNPQSASDSVIERNLNQEFLDNDISDNQTITSTNDDSTIESNENEEEYDDNIDNHDDSSNDYTEKEYSTDDDTNEGYENNKRTNDESTDDDDDDDDDFFDNNEVIHEDNVSNNETDDESLNIENTNRNNERDLLSPKERRIQNHIIQNGLTQSQARTWLTEEKIPFNQNDFTKLKNARTAQEEFTFQHEKNLCNMKKIFAKRVYNKINWRI